VNIEHACSRAAVALKVEEEVAAVKADSFSASRAEEEAATTPAKT